MTSGKKQTVTKNKVKKQKRLLLDTVENLNDKFCSEYSANCISYAAFARLRPFWVRLPTSKDRDTCMCKRHANVQLMTDKLFQIGAVKYKNCEDALKLICCDVNNKSCMMRLCDSCQDRHIFFSDSAAKDDHVVVWSEWTTSMHEYEKNGEVKSSKVTTKCLKRGTVKELKAEFDASVRSDFAAHVYTLRHQFRAYKSLKDDLHSNEAVVHVDFSENYECKFAAEIQSAHFGASHHQVTIHTGVVYKTDGHQSFASISDSLRHDPAAIWAHMTPVLLQLRQSDPQVTHLHFFSDGPTPQYRNKQNFYLLSTQIYNMGFHGATWNFFASGHGKGAPDAIGGAVKRQADAMVNTGCDIADARNLFSCLQRSDSVINFHFVETTDIDHMDVQCSKSLKAFVGTMKIHQLHVNAERSVSYRNFSCFCSTPTVCSCHNIRHSRFPVEENMEVAALPTSSVTSVEAKSAITSVESVDESVDDTTVMPVISLLPVTSSSSDDNRSKRANVMPVATLPTSSVTLVEANSAITSVENVATDS